ncbi:hypothetical protein ABPG75_000920 [Micractinium tetrahymenae]
MVAPTPLPAPATTTTMPTPPTGKTITIDPWTLPGGPVPPFGTRAAKVGDSAMFVFQGLHGLFQIPSGTCPQTFTDTPPLKQIMAPTNNGRATVMFTTPGTFWYACPVPGHCPAAQYYPSGSSGGSEYGTGGSTTSPPSTTPAPTITIDPWTIPGGAVQPFGTRNAKVGDSAVFVFQGLHGLFQIPDGTCPQTFTDTPPLKQIMAPTNNGRATVTFTTAGNFWYACPVPGHCPAGMLIKFVVT